MFLSYLHVDYICFVAKYDFIPLLTYYYVVMQEVERKS